MTNELLLDVLTDVVLIIQGTLRVRVRVNVRIRLGIELGLGLCFMFTFVCAIIFNLSNNAIVVCCCRLLCKT